jgi:tRNA G26 N,N-dimethylase Trm1
MKGCSQVISLEFSKVIRSNKGVEVLSTISREHYNHVLLRVLRGKQRADDTLEQIQPLFHCKTCGERGFKLLNCGCDASANKNIEYFGEVWCGPIQNGIFSCFFLKVRSFFV